MGGKTASALGKRYIMGRFGGHMGQMLGVHTGRDRWEVGGRGANGVYTWQAGEVVG